MDEFELMTMKRNTFMMWFHDQAIDQNVEADELLKNLAYGSESNVTTYAGYDINVYYFTTKARDGSGTMQNSGIVLEAEGAHFVSHTKPGMQNRYLTVKLIN